MISSPHCQRSTQPVKNGRTPAGSQRYLCRACRGKYPPAPRPQGYGDDDRRRLVSYPGRPAVATGKSQTYSVEAATAEVRHCLARLGRTARCFARSIDALRRAVKRFVHAWNRRQRHTRAFPRYACHVMDVVCP